MGIVKWKEENGGYEKNRGSRFVFGHLGGGRRKNHAVEAVVEVMSVVAVGKEEPGFRPTDLHPSLGAEDEDEQLKLIISSGANQQKRQR